MAKTRDALKIIDHMIGDDVELRHMIAEESLNVTVAQMIYDARTSAGLTQQELAQLAGTNHPVIARLEDADYEGHSLSQSPESSIDRSNDPCEEGHSPAPTPPWPGYSTTWETGFTKKVNPKETPMASRLALLPIFIAGLTSFLVSGPPPAGSKKPRVHGDPARLERIRATKMPKFTKPVMFDTPEADAIVSALEVFPPDNPWNLDVSDWPLHPNSKNIIASIGPGKPLRYNPDMGYILVPPGQKKIEVKLVGYPGESDKGPFPVPDKTPIEGWPVHYLRTKKKVTLEDIQRDALKEDGDRHALVVDPAQGKLYEFYQLKKTDAGWQAAQSSIFDLKSNKLRPDGWTSADAAGLPIFPAVVRYDELKRGQIEHALRVTVVKTKREYVYPATHYASRRTDKDLPRMGERIRLKRSFDVSSFSKDVRTILKGLQQYGMFVADNGIDWAISVAPDPRIGVLHEELRKIKGSDFEVVQPPAGYQPAK